MVKAVRGSAGTYGHALALAAHDAAGRLHEWEDAAPLIPSQIYLPLPAIAEARPPVIVYLHGGGNGAARLMNAQSLPGLLQSNATFRKRFPFIGLFPCSTCSTYERGWVPANLVRVSALLSRLIKEHRGDPHRIILCGQGMGGAGVWRYAAGAPL